MKKHVAEQIPLSMWWISIMGAFCIMALFIGLIRHFTQPLSADQVRFAERQKNLADLTRQAQDQLDHYSVIDPAKNAVRLPISRAMEITVQEWGNADLARTNLLERLNNLTGASTNIRNQSISQ